MTERVRDSVAAQNGKCIILHGYLNWNPSVPQNAVILWNISTVMAANLIVSLS